MKGEHSTPTPSGERVQIGSLNTLKATKRIIWQEWEDPYQKLLTEGTDAFAQTPLGAMPLHQGFCPSSHFTFWVGHANFDLRQSVVSRMAVVPGVETLDVLTRYRFQMAVGRAFNVEKVKRAVAAAACDDVQPMRPTLSRQYPFWAVHVVQGQFCTVGGKTSKEVEEQGKYLEEKASRSYYSWR